MHDTFKTLSKYLCKIMKISVYTLSPNNVFVRLYLNASFSVVYREMNDEQIVVPQKPDDHI